MSRESLRADLHERLRAAHVNFRPGSISRTKFMAKMLEHLAAHPDDPNPPYDYVMPCGFPLGDQLRMRRSFSKRGLGGLKDEDWAILEPLGTKREGYKTSFTERMIEHIEFGGDPNPKQGAVTSDAYKIANALHSARKGVIAADWSVLIPLGVARAGQGIELFLGYYRYHIRLAGTPKVFSTYKLVGADGTRWYDLGQNYCKVRAGKPGYETTPEQRAELEGYGMDFKIERTGRPRTSDCEQIAEQRGVTVVEEGRRYHVACATCGQEISTLTYRNLTKRTTWIRRECGH
jgi:hypothetical protein